VPRVPANSSIPNVIYQLGGLRPRCSRYSLAIIGSGRSQTWGRVMDRFERGLLISSASGFVVFTLLIVYLAGLN
jgi:hypothetical protein